MQGIKWLRYIPWLEARENQFFRECREVKELFTDKMYKLQNGVLTIELTPGSTLLFVEK